MIKDAIKILYSKNCSCVVFKDNEIFTSYEKGILPLITLSVKNGLALENAFVADKIIGKAAAIIIAFNKVKDCYGDIMSQEAIKILEANNISYSFNKKVEMIRNRDNTDMCPIEKLVFGSDDIFEGYKIIYDFFINKIN